MNENEEKILNEFLRKFLSQKSKTRKIYKMVTNNQSFLNNELISIHIKSKENFQYFFSHLQRFKLRIFLFLSGSACVKLL